MKPSEAEQGRRDDAQWRKDARRRKNRKTRRSEGEERAFLVSRANSIFDSASRHSRLRQGSKIDYSSITLRLSYPLPFLLLGSLTCLLLLLLLFLSPSSFTSSSSASSGGSLPLLPSAPASTSSPLVPLLTVSAWTHRTRDPLSGFFGARLLPFAPLLSRPDLGASRLHVACPNDVSERTGTTVI